jgi:hypothetical protein
MMRGGIDAFMIANINSSSPIIFLHTGINGGNLGRLAFWSLRLMVIVADSLLPSLLHSRSQRSLR